MAIETRVVIYIFPCLVLGSGLKQSTLTLLEDYSKAGMGRSRATRMFGRCYKINSSWLRLVFYLASRSGPISRWRFCQHPSFQSLTNHEPGSQLLSCIFPVPSTGRSLYIHLAQSHLAVAIFSSILSLS